MTGKRVLEINLKNHIRHTSVIGNDRLPITQRKEVFECSCCPPNINRTFASINEYIYGVDGETLYVNQFMSSEAVFESIKVKQHTNYPVDSNDVSQKPADGVKVFNFVTDVTTMVILLNDKEKVVSVLMTEGSYDKSYIGKAWCSVRRKYRRYIC